MKKAVIQFTLLIASISIVAQTQQDCLNPGIAQAGINSIPVSNTEHHWYKYTVPGNGELTLSTEQKAHVNVYTGTCKNLKFVDNGYKKLSLSSLNYGDKILIKWIKNDSTAFNWNLNFKPFDTINSCFAPDTAHEGVNTVPDLDRELYIYKYLVPADGTIRLSTNEKATVTVYTGFCGNLKFVDSDYKNLSVPDLVVGDEIYIAWKSKNKTGFDWELAFNTTTSTQYGFDCLSAITAIEGVNSVPETDSAYFYYSFTMPTNGVLDITTDANETVFIYAGNCTDYTLLTMGGAGTTSVATLTEGDESIILWTTNNGGNFDWDLNISSLETGNSCGLAVEAAEGFNPGPDTDAANYWYTFTMPTNGNLQITFPENEDAYVYTGACESLNATSEWSANSILVSSLSAGEVVYIEWVRTIFGIDNDWEWEVEVQSQQETNHDCFSADTAIEGTNNTFAIQYRNGFPTSENRRWYQYEMPDDGDLLFISLLEYSPVEIYSGTCNDLTFLGGYTDSLMITSLSAGSNLFFVWDTFSTVNNIEWYLIVMPDFPITENSCSHPATANVGVNTVPETDLYSYWYTYTVPESGNLELTSLTGGDYVYVYQGLCNDNIILGEGRNNLTIEDLSPGEEVYIVWNTILTGGGFDWQLELAVDPTLDRSILAPTSLSEKTSNALLIYPNPVTTHLTLDAAENSIKQIQLFSADGQIITEFDPASRMLNMEGLSTGIYILKLSTVDQVYSHRILKR